VKRLAATLRDAGIAVATTREPGGSPGAERIRALLVEGEVARWDAVTETLLHFAARRDHLEKTIRPALAAGRWVISDRFYDSTLAYQGHGHGVATKLLEALLASVVDGDRPDLTLILDLPVEAGLARAAGRTGGAGREDRYERMDVAFHRRLRDGFHAIAAAEPERCVIVDAAVPVAEVERRIRAIVGQRLGVSLP
jgi:dTMP kinase